MATTLQSLGILDCFVSVVHIRLMCRRQTLKLIVLFNHSNNNRSMMLVTTLQHAIQVI